MAGHLTNHRAGAPLTDQPSPAWAAQILCQSAPTSTDKTHASNTSSWVPRCLLLCRSAGAANILGVTANVSTIIAPDAAFTIGPVATTGTGQDSSKAGQAYIPTALCWLPICVRSPLTPDGTLGGSRWCARMTRVQLACIRYASCLCLCCNCTYHVAFPFVAKRRFWSPACTH